MKPFELKVDPQTNQCNIIDNFESKRKNAICIYNDLGCHPFSAAPALCDKLNDLTEEVMVLRRKEMSLDEILRYNDEYFLDGEWGNFTLHHIRLGSDNHIITPTMVVDRLNKLSKLNKKVIEDNIGLQKENHELEKQLHELIDYVNELIEENQALKQSDNITDLETQIMKLKEENQSLKKELFEAKSECLWVTSDEVDRALHYEDEIEELRKEIFE